jgi:hypothetical protein
MTEEFTIPPLVFVRDYLRELRSGLRATLHVAAKHGPKDVKFERSNRIVRADHIDDLDTLAWRALEKLEKIGDRLENEHRLVAAAEALVNFCAFNAPAFEGNDPARAQRLIAVVDEVRTALAKSKERSE